MTAHLAAAVGAAVFAGLVVRTLRPPRRPLVVRVGPYAELLRPRLGTGSPDVTWLRGSVGPPLPVGLVARLSRKMDNSTDESLELRLRQAGFQEHPRVPVEHHGLTIYLFASRCQAFERALVLSERDLR